MKQHLTEARVRDLKWAGKDLSITDSAMPGFMATVTKRSKTYKIKCELWQGVPGSRRNIRDIKRAIGAVDAISLKEARKIASGYLEDIKSGKDPFGNSTAILTLQSAARWYI